MKRYPTILLLLLSTVLVCDCSPKEDDKNISVPGNEGDREPASYSFLAQCIRTDGGIDGVKYPQVVVLE